MKEGTLGVTEMQEFIQQTAIQFPNDKLKVRYVVQFHSVEKWKIHCHVKNIFVKSTFYLMISSIKALLSQNVSLNVNVNELL